MDYYTDFIDEKIVEKKDDKNVDYEIRSYKNIVQTSFIKIKRSTKNARKGEYASLQFLDLENNYKRKQIEKIYKLNLKHFLTKYLTKMTHNILVIGLGNRYIASDSLGPRVINHIEATFHQKKKNKVMCFALGVKGQTGAQSYEVIKSLLTITKFDLVILIDNLASRRIERLNKAIQINDVGISPGSGVYNHNKEISFQTIKVPTISIGVASVVEMSNILKNLDVNEKIEEYQNLFVSLKSVDEDNEILANIIARGINEVIRDL